MSKSIFLKSVFSVWYRNALMYSKTWKLNILPNFFEPVFYLLGLGLGLGFYIQEIHGVPYALFLTPGLIMIAAMNGASFESSYNVYVRMNYNRTYDAMIATPVTEEEIVLGEIFWSITRAWIYGCAFFLITAIFGLIPSLWSLSLLILILPVGYMFSAIGMSYSFSIPTIDLFSVYFTLFLTPLYIFSDTFFPLQERLGTHWMWIAEITPLFHCVRIARSATSGYWKPILIWDLSYIILVGVFFHTLAVRQFKKRIHQPAR